MKQNEKNKAIPPFTEALINYGKQSQIPFDTPGHHGGAFFNMTPEGRRLTEFFGNAMFLCDVSDSDDALGDPSSHHGTAGQAEHLAADTFHADRTWFVLHGTSVSNRICCQALLSENDLVLFDRNNHKSIYQGALLQAGATPVYLESVRLDSGIIGGLSDTDLDRRILREKAARISPRKAKKKHPYRLAVLQLATYDGFIADAGYFIDLLEPLCDYILFDSAWAGYEQFLPLLKNLSPLSIDTTDRTPGILVTQSVHKQLAGFSMTSQIHKKDSHIKKEKYYLPDDVLDNAFLMNISTSPYFPLFASLEMNAFIHRRHGDELWHKAACFAVELRKKILNTCENIRPLIPLYVDGKPWQDYPTETILSDPRFWNYEKVARQQGAKRFSPHYLIDPCKILLVTDCGQQKIPASLLSQYLQGRHLTPEKCGLYSLLFLAEPGDTEEKADILTKMLHEFETSEWNRPVNEVLPLLSGKYPMSVAALSHGMDKFLSSHKASVLEEKIFTTSNPSVMSGKKATTSFIKGKRKLLPLERLEGKTALECAMVYPPGICSITAGEKWTAPLISYFLFIEDYMNQFPDFAPECVGLHVKDRNGKKKLFAWIHEKKND